jgi:hypothetical protein
VHFSTLAGLQFDHSAAPTVEQGEDGPDSYRFVPTLDSHASRAERDR